MKFLAIQTENPKGNEPNYKENFGCVVTFINHEKDFIKVDNFEGKGDSFKQRELSQITIVENGNVLFSGDKYELYQQLKK